jgi:hypothetical protein
LRSIEIELHCTDPSFVNPLLSDLAQEIGFYGISAYRLGLGATAEGASMIETQLRDVYRWRLYGIDECLQEAWRLIVERFVQRGWELYDSCVASKECPKDVLVFLLEDGGAGPERPGVRQQRTALEPSARRDTIQTGGA